MLLLLLASLQLYFLANVQFCSVTEDWVSFQSGKCNPRELEQPTTWLHVISAKQWWYVIIS